MSPGFFPRRMLMVFSCWAICRSKSGTSSAAVYTNCSDWRTSSRELSPCCSSVCVNFRDSLREPSVRLEISNCATEICGSCVHFAGRWGVVVLGTENLHCLLHFDSRLSLVEMDNDFCYLSP